MLAIYCGFSLGFVVAGVMSSWMIPAFGWQSLFWVGGLAPLLLLPLLHLFLPEAISTLTRPGADREKALFYLRKLDPKFRADLLPAAALAQPKASAERVPIRRLFTRSAVYGTLLLWTVFLINLGEFYAMQSWMPTILTDLGHDPSTVVAGTSLFTVGGIVVALVVGPLMDRVSPYTTLSALYAAGFVFVAGVGLALEAPLPILLASTFFAGFCVSGGQKSVIALSAVFYPAEVRSTGVGWALGIGRFGGIAGPLIVGAALAAGLSPEGVFYALAGPMLVMAMVIYLLGRRYARVATNG